MGEENHWWFRELAAGRTATRNVATMEGILPDLPSLSNVMVNIFHASKAAEKQARPDTGLYFFTMACMPLPESLAYRPIGHRMSLHIECLWFQAGTSKMSPISLLKQSGVSYLEVRVPMGARSTLWQTSHEDSVTAVSSLVSRHQRCPTNGVHHFISYIIISDAFQASDSFSVCPGSRHKDEKVTA